MLLPFPVKIQEEEQTVHSMTARQTINLITHNQDFMKIKHMRIKTERPKIQNTETLITTIVHINKKIKTSIHCESSSNQWNRLPLTKLIKEEKIFKINSMKKTKIIAKLIKNLPIEKLIKTNKTI
jgi:hypothetical protein